MNAYKRANLIWTEYILVENGISFPQQGYVNDDGTVPVVKIRQFLYTKGQSNKYQSLERKRQRRAGRGKRASARKGKYSRR